MSRIEGESIVAAAICMHENNLVLSLSRPSRHSDVQQGAARLGLDILGKHEQGFLTSTGRFVRRAPARRIADLAGQLVREPINHVFTSEELW